MPHDMLWFSDDNNSGDDPQVTAVAHIPVSYTIMRLARALEETCAAAAAGGWVAFVC